MKRGHKTESSEKKTRRRPSSDDEPLLPSFGTSLRDEVRDALLRIIRDRRAPASAVASASRTLCEFYGSSPGSSDASPAAELTVEELDAEIARQGAGASALDRTRQ